jgi:DNA-binding NarL/FixJ family response regulator
MPRVLVVHRHALFREALAVVLAAGPASPMVTTAGGAADRFGAGRGSAPDVALVDAGLPGGAGLRLVGVLAAAGSWVVALAGNAEEAAAARTAGTQALACPLRPLPALLTELGGVEAPG